MGLFPQQFIDDLKLQANIVAVVQDYVSLKKAGATYKGLCPFHSEKTPSFHVNPDKGFFHCFGCGVGGDVFKFLELHEKVAFPDAVKMLAQKFGIAVPELSEDASDDTRRDAALREQLLKAHEVAAAWFREQLASAAGARARQQLKDRDVLPKTLDQLGLGYAPMSREALKSHLLKMGFSQPLLLQSGLVVQRDSGEVIDRFRNRLMVPICRDTGSVIAFGGRQMEADQGGPKYLNSPETAIYSKSRTLYGLNLTKGAIRKVGFAVLVEGYFDFAQVFQSDAAPAVASCGTALTPQQAQLLRRFTSKVVLSYDPDAAGEGAAARSCELLVAEGFEVNVAVLDRGEDPDAFIRAHGGEAYRAKLRTSRPYLEYLLDQAAAEVDMAHDEQRRQFLAKMLGVAARIPDAAGRDQFADRLAHKARITEEVVRAEIRKAAVNRKTTVTAREMPSFGQLKPAERALVWGLIHRTSEALAAIEQLDDEDMAILGSREILRTARNLRAEPADLLPSELIRRLSTMNAQLVTALAGDAAPPVKTLGECVLTIKRMRLERERADIQTQIDRLLRDGASTQGPEIEALLRRKHAVACQLEN